MDQREIEDYCMSLYLSESVPSRLIILIRDQREGKDEDKTPIMLNPAHILVGMSGDNKAMAEAFAKWVKRLDGGQKVVSKFEKDGVPLYTPAPLEKVSSKL